MSEDAAKPKAADLRLSREPDGSWEVDLVRAAKTTTSVYEVWVRYRGSHLTGDTPVMRVWWGVEPNPPAEELRKLDALETELQQRRFYDHIYMEFHRKPLDVIPKERPSRIWLRSSILVVRR